MLDSQTGYGVKVDFKKVYKACDINEQNSSAIVAPFFTQMKRILKERRVARKKDWPAEKIITFNELDLIL